mmetsp:Transcript_32776/g.52289  ORF Transcript_32776/g.52289 Transcript_32776/m.52289 type:complete len:289 (-) Transcript_32776:108-974(-)
MPLCMIGTLLLALLSVSFCIQDDTKPCFDEGSSLQRSRSNCEAEEEDVDTYALVQIDVRFGTAAESLSATSARLPLSEDDIDAEAEDTQAIATHSEDLEDSAETDEDEGPKARDEDSGFRLQAQKVEEVQDMVNVDAQTSKHSAEAAQKYASIPGETNAQIVAVESASRLSELDVDVNSEETTNQPVQQVRSVESGNGFVWLSDGPAGTSPATMLMSMQSSVSGAVSSAASSLQGHINYISKICGDRQFTIAITMWGFFLMAFIAWAHYTNMAAACGRQCIPCIPPKD